MAHELAPDSEANGERADSGTNGGRNSGTNQTGSTVVETVLPVSRRSVLVGMGAAVAAPAMATDRARGDDHGYGVGGYGAGSYGGVEEADDNPTNPGTVDMESADAGDITTTSAVLYGELTELAEVDEATVFFQWDEVEADFGNATEKHTRDSPGTFEAEVTDLESDTEYEFRAVAEITGSTERSDSRTFRTDPEEVGSQKPVIDRFEVSESNGAVWNRYEIDWAVSHETGELDNVLSKLRYDGTVVATESTRVNGDSAEFTHVVRTRGDVDEVRLSVNDHDNRSTTQTKNV